MAEGSARDPLDYPLTAPPAPGETIEVAPGVQWVRMPLPFPPSHINLWLVEDGDGWAIVDTGIGSDQIKALWERILAKRLNGRPVSRVLVTHFHPDHVGLAAWLAERWRVEVWMTAGEWTTARAVHAEDTPADVAQRAEFYRRHGVDAAAQAHFAKPMTGYRRSAPSIPSSFRRLRGGEGLAIGGRNWIPIIGRGHAPEHACLHCEDAGVLIAGDILLPRITPNVSVRSHEPFQNPLRDFLDSLDGFAPVSDATLVLPAHGLPYRSARRRIAELRAHHAKDLQVLLDALAEPRSATECLPLLYRREIGLDLLSFAIGEAIAHLHLLEAQGAIERFDVDGVWKFRRR